MAFRVADQAAPYLPKPFADARFAFRGKTLLGQAEARARWKRGMLAVAGGDCGADPGSCFGTFNWGVGELYSARYFPPETKPRIEALVGDVKTAYRKRHRASRLDEPGDPRRSTEEARHLHDQGRLSRHAARLFEPRDPPRRPASATSAAPPPPTGSFMSTAAPGPVDKADWLMTPQTNDAYNGSLRDIVFPAGILQAPIFDAGADPAYNYGAIGGVIGHELTHGFDDQGRTIDAAGALRDWWTPADAAEFKRRAAMLGDSICPVRAGAGRAHQARPDDGREHRRPRRPDARARRLSRLAARSEGAGRSTA